MARSSILRSVAATVTVVAACRAGAEPPATLPASPVGAVPTTAPAVLPLTTSPTTGPTTGPAATRPAAAAAADAAAIARLLRDLANDDWKVRQRATIELAKFGDDAVAGLKGVVAATDNLDARTAAQEVLARIAADHVTGPSLVTLHLKDAPAKVAFAELAKQASTELKTFPDGLFDQGHWSNVNVDVDREPFWTVMRDLSERTGLNFRDVNGEVRLTQMGQVGGRAVVAGPFLVVATSLTRTQSVAIGPKQPVAEESFGLQMAAYAEPKLTVLRVGSDLRLDEAVDDNGNSLLPTAAENRNASYYGGGAGGMWNLYARLHYPADRPGKQITRLRGSATFVVQTKSQRIEVPDLPSVKESVHVVGGSRVVIREFKKTDADTYALTIVVGQGGAVGGVEQIQGTIQSRLRVLDAQGRRLDSRGWSSTGRNNEMEMTLNYAAGGLARRRVGLPVGLGGGGAAGAAGEPVKLVWEIPTETQDLTVPFDFTDLPLPRP